MSLRHERDNAVRALHLLMGYFRSGNRIPVERATIRAKSREVRDAFDVLRNPRRMKLRRYWKRVRLNDIFVQQ